MFPLAGLLSMPGSPAEASAESIQRHLESTYCASIGAEISHLPPEEFSFFHSHLESTSPTSTLTPANRRNLHSLLVQSQAFDHFMARKFSATKRYSLEGAESMIPALHTLLTTASHSGTQQVVLAMPHRGRLNVLTTLLDYPARALFAKVQGKSLVPPGMQGDCDVLSHISHTTPVKVGSRSVKVSLLPNPSHLEAINPVALGKTRAEQDLLPSSLSLDERQSTVLCIQLHGDAAFAGQGVVAEALSFAYLPDFSVGGSVHLILNNQVGFTAERHKSRSSLYASDMAKVIGAAVLHVNGDDVEAVVFASRLAVEYRQRFRKDVILDLITYRRWGHNEIDEPSFTQPAMYRSISSHPTIATLYGHRLQQTGLIKDDHIERIERRVLSHLDAEFTASKTYVPSAESFFQREWQGYTQATHCSDHVSTGVDAAVLREATLASVALPAGFRLHPRLQRTHVDERVKAVEEGTAIDWATAEAMAFGTLLREGWNVRLCGQDSQRGTFSHRHAVLVDQETGEAHTPLHSAYPGKVDFVSSNLSEFAVLGFEYGHSINSPHTLNLFEAQFGDFLNTAQPIVDNFIVSGESKWLKSTGLVLLLPHGQDATGPEHVTARIERFLQLCNHDPTSLIQSSAPAQPVNFLVANPTTPAQYFHLLRRQMLRPYRKPLVIPSPKNLLRHAKAVSPLSAMEVGSTFHSVLGEEERDGVEILIFCSGRVYYELKQRRDSLGRDDVALVRIEELCPFPWLEVRRHLRLWEERGQGRLREVRWFQEEPRNAGAWSFVRERMDTLLEGLEMKEKRLLYVGRGPLAAAAVGSVEAHNREVEAIYHRIFQ